MADGEGVRRSQPAHTSRPMASRPALVLTASILGSGAVFLEGTVANVALPAIGRDFHLGMAGLQGVMNAYLLMLSALMLLGGALGDRFSRARVFVGGAVAFAAATTLCALAPGAIALYI